MSGLTLELRVDPTAQGPALIGTYVNAGPAPLALAFWWNRRLEVHDAHGALVPAGPGPVLPCGSAEDWTVLAPGQRFERDEFLGCTQPAGEAADIGWAYTLAPGSYRLRLIFEAPAAHGFTQSAPHPQAFVGRAVSNEVTWVVQPEPHKGLLARLFGG
jgi:hypothetical protein